MQAENELNLMSQQHEFLTQLLQKISSLLFLQHKKLKLFLSQDTKLWKK